MMKRANRGFYVGRALISAALGVTTAIGHAMSPQGTTVVNAIEKGAASHLKKMNGQRDCPIPFDAREDVAIQLAGRDVIAIVSGTMRRGNQNEYAELKRDVDEIRRAASRFKLKFNELKEISEFLNGMASIERFLDRQRTEEKPDATGIVIAYVFESIEGTANSTALLQNTRIAANLWPIRQLKLSRIKTEDLTSIIQDTGFKVGDRAFAYLDVAKANQGFFSPYAQQNTGVLFGPAPKKFEFTNDKAFLAAIYAARPDMKGCKPLEEALAKQHKDFGPLTYPQVTSSTYPNALSRGPI